MISVNRFCTRCLSTDQAVSTALSSQEYLFRKLTISLNLRWHEEGLAEGGKLGHDIGALVGSMVVEHHDQLRLLALWLDSSH